METKVSLATWESNGWLVGHQSTRQEIGDLLSLAKRDLADARTAEKGSEAFFAKHPSGRSGKRLLTPFFRRNIGGYERAGAVSELEVNEMLVLAERIYTEVIDWLQTNHPELL